MTTAGEPTSPQQFGRRWYDHLPHGGRWSEPAVMVLLGLMLAIVALAIDAAATIRASAHLARIATSLRSDAVAADRMRGELMTQLKLQTDALAHSNDANERQHLLLSQLVREHRRYWRLICINTARTDEAMKGCFATFPGDRGVPALER